MQAEKKTEACLRYLLTGHLEDNSEPAINVTLKCLKGTTFVVTGISKYLKQTTKLINVITKYGGKILPGVTRKLNYLISCNQSNPIKLNMAEKCNVPPINEKQLLDIMVASSTNDPVIGDVLSDVDASDNCQEAFTEKYRPKRAGKFIGHEIENGPLNQLRTWLLSWRKNVNSKTNTTGSKFKRTDGSEFNGCLLYGPPGIGKTTAIQIICKELNYNVIEHNASETRNANLIKNQLSQLVYSSNGMEKYIDNFTTQHKRVLVMEEVDGMTGNADIGGIHELIKLIQNSSIPIICTCNDMQKPSIRTLSSHLFKLKFSRPNITCLHKGITNICKLEKIELNDEIKNIIYAANSDIRKILNEIQMIKMKDNMKIKPSRVIQPINTPWDMSRRMFNSDENEKMSLQDQIDLFFYDTNVAALFAHENYLYGRPK